MLDKEANKVLGTEANGKRLIFRIFENFLVILIMHLLVKIYGL